MLPLYLVFDVSLVTKNQNGWVLLLPLSFSMSFCFPECFSADAENVAEREGKFNFTASPSEG